MLDWLKNRSEEPQERTVFLFDSPTLELFDVGLVLRARKTRGDTDDPTVEVRPEDPRASPSTG